jgi:2-polyprenyl-3-methyl-5-hydroxy-6-metoxy-1,4-benzoquinol methylase
MSLQARVSLRIRERMLRHLPLTSGTRFLEVGATPDMYLADSNYFSVRAAGMGCEVWVTSPEDCAEMAKVHGFHWLSFDRYMGLTRESSTFDVVLSSAVLEHVGSNDAKTAHLQRMGEIARHCVAATTPNRGHWLEFHTKLPFLHWLPKRAHRSMLRVLGMRRWASAEMLDLLGARAFRRVVEAAWGGWDVRYPRITWAGGVSNLMAVGTRRTP